MDRTLESNSITWKETFYEHLTSKDGKRIWRESHTRQSAYKAPGLYRTTKVDEHGRLTGTTIRDAIATREPADTTGLASPPLPRSKPAWYTASNLPAPTTRTLPPVASYATTPTFAWPLTGQVISDFGSGGSGERNNGINIAAVEGAPIRASAAGTVSYAGNELRGYGNLVLIKHDDGYVTAYAHAERIVVQRGDTVTKGQVIAYAGSTGDVTTPQLHFEIRHGVQPVNPRSLIASSSN